MHTCSFHVHKFFELTFSELENLSFHQAFGINWSKPYSKPPPPEGLRIWDVFQELGLSPSGGEQTSLNFCMVRDKNPGTRSQSLGRGESLSPSWGGVYCKTKYLNYYMLKISKNAS